jgi:hypothetical protein
LLAEQRVMYQYGNTLPRSDIAKGVGDFAGDEFHGEG